MAVDPGYAYNQGQRYIEATKNNDYNLISRLEADANNKGYILNREVPNLSGFGGSGSQQSLGFTPTQPQLRGLSLGDLYGLTYDQDTIRKLFDEATAAEFARKQKEYAMTENKFYGNLFGTQSTALDTIRKSNAQAVATGASRGMQAANELSAILGLSQEGVAGSTDLAQQRNLLADNEAEAYTKNAMEALMEANKVKQAIGTMDSGLYAADTQFQVGQMDYYARLDAAMKELEAAGLAAEAQRFAAQLNLQGSQYTADRNLEGTRYSSDKHFEGVDLSSKRQLLGQQGYNAAIKSGNASQAEYYKWLMSDKNPQNQGPITAMTLIDQAVQGNNRAAFDAEMARMGVTDKKVRDQRWNELMDLKNPPAVNPSSGFPSMWKPESETLRRIIDPAYFIQTG